MKGTHISQKMRQVHLISLFLNEFFRFFSIVLFCFVLLLICLHFYLFIFFPSSTYQIVSSSFYSHFSLIIVDTVFLFWKNVICFTVIHKTLYSCFIYLPFLPIVNLVYFRNSAILKSYIVSFFEDIIRKVNIRIVYCNILDSCCI